jgi:hypothetical protein
MEGKIDFLESQVKKLQAELGRALNIIPPITTVIVTLCDIDQIRHALSWLRSRWRRRGWRERKRNST